MSFRTVVKREDYSLIYMETLKQINKDKYSLILDFDGFAENISSEECMSVTDVLHDIIIAEFEQTIKEPVYRYMRQEKEEV